MKYLIHLITSGKITEFKIHKDIMDTVMITINLGELRERVHLSKTILKNPEHIKKIIYDAVLQLRIRRLNNEIQNNKRLS